MSVSAKKYVLTGGPFSGKSTTLDLLIARGHSSIPEAARIIIEEEQQKDGEALPWKNLQLFQHLVAARQLKAEEGDLGEHVFLDRGLNDIYAYSRYGHVLVPEIVINNAKDRYEKVFLFELLPGYKSDAVRKESEEMRMNIHRLISEAYEEFGYNPISVPVLPPEERVRFILDTIGL